MSIKRIIASAALTVSLAACANVQPEQYHQETVRNGQYMPLQAENELMASELARWAAVPPVTVVDVPANSLQPRRIAATPPSDLLIRPVNVQMVDEGRTVADLAFLLAADGVPVVVDSRDEGLEEARVPLFRYRGTLGGLLQQLEAGAGITAVGTSAGGVLLTRAASYEFPAPANQQEVIEGLLEDLTAAGAVDPTWSARTATIRYRAPVQLQSDVIAPLLERARENLALVRLQVAMVSISATSERARGFDWGKFRAGLASEDTAAEQGEGFPGAAGRMLSAAGPMLAGAGTFSAGGVVLGLAGAIDFLDKIGHGQTRQQFEVTTFSGVPVTMRDGSSIPYVESISTTTTDGAAVSTGSANTATVEAGTTLTMLPAADVSSGLISTSIDAETRQLLGFRDLSAGNQVGTLSQPETRDHRIESHIVGRAGEVVILDGSRLSSVKGDADGPLGYEVLAHENNEGESTSMFLLVRQALTVFRPTRES